ncbi:hypothetical protein TYRP_018741 [Tyrophagus putrescentiae]|nr:hypothetical protein TYRP_018741 [Tyrophagus putrescentiae]
MPSVLAHLLLIWHHHQLDSKAQKSLLGFGDFSGLHTSNLFLLKCNDCFADFLLKRISNS